MIRTQRGITLVELLVTLGILSFIGIIIWSVFFQGASYSQKSSTKNGMQQEANIIITRLIKIHQTSDQYQINSSECKLTVTFTKNASTQTQDLSNSKFCISAKIVDMATETVLNGTDFIDPNEQDISYELTIEDAHDSTNPVVENGTLYRLKDGGV